MSDQQEHWSDDPDQWERARAVNEFGYRHGHSVKERGFVKLAKACRDLDITDEEGRAWCCAERDRARDRGYDARAKMQGGAGWYCSFDALAGAFLDRIAERVIRGFHASSGR